ncbi:DUF1289 domain-containing protein [Novosphingobium sp. JCM 18896]|uniref:DUF1289 domain-containing protein n=1 Tax=Novosphingobium sp. JCM 18896 TaxID=2989731 RepID=UPI002223A9BB|nr:DUF1289 domain-containing protein [Novosphingobium sp. JCM 18896]MCW1431744.1 DUF1289 domain-containing protein [Novosphingobium sp. JCM 18896]
MYAHQPRSPCTGVCRIAPTTGWCEGCLRTLDEIADWAMLPVREKQALLRALEDRRRSIGAQ